MDMVIVGTGMVCLLALSLILLSRLKETEGRVDDLEQVLTKIVEEYEQEKADRNDKMGSMWD